MRYHLFIVIAMLFCSATVLGQVQFSGGPAYLKGSGYYDNHAYLIGGNLSAKYVIFERVLIGGTARMYQANTTSYQSFSTIDKQSNFGGDIDYMFRPLKKVRPYMGVNVGVAHTSHMVNYQKTFEHHIEGGLKFGTQVTLGQSTGFFTSLGYNWLPAKAAQYELIGDPRMELTEHINDFWTFDVGLFIRLYVKTTK